MTSSGRTFCRCHERRPGRRHWQPGLSGAYDCPRWADAGSRGTGNDAGEPVTQAAVAALLKQEGFAELATGDEQARSVPAGGFHVSGHDGGVLVCWIPVSGQDPRDLDAFGRSYDMALAYAAAACKAGRKAERWGVIWHYALITDSRPRVREAEIPPESRP